MNDRKQYKCVPNTSDIIIVIMETPNDRARSKKYTYAGTWTYEFESYADSPCLHRTFPHCQKEQRDDKNE
jgi:hypothetical protein